MLLLGCGGAGDPPLPDPAPGVPALPVAAIRGACLVPGPRGGAGGIGVALDRLQALGGTWVSLGAHGRQAGLGATDIRFPDPGPFGGTDAGVVAALRAAHERGMRVLVVPTLWLGDDLWRGDIHMASEAEWAAWFASYRRFLLHYAGLAADEGADMLAVGLELGGTAEREAEWRALIAEVRRVYPGPLTYAANWWREAEALPFWDAVDRVGVQFFFPLSASADASDAELRAGLAGIRRRLESLSARVGRPYLLTEIGYRSSPAPWVEPWVWHADGEDEAAQARCYRLVAEAFHEAPRFDGLFWWNWLVAADRVRPRDRRFSPQGRPAEAVVAAMFRDGGGGDEPAAAP